MIEIYVSFLSIFDFVFIRVDSRSFAADFCFLPRP